MESTTGALSNLLASTKTKLIVLSSLIGVSAIFYFTKNYLQQGQFLPVKSCLKKTKGRPKVIGGKRHVVIQEVDGAPVSRRVFKRQKSYKSSRRSSNASLLLENANDEASDINLNKAIADLDHSITEVEEIFDLKDTNTFKPSIFTSTNMKIENKINRLKDLLDLAQDMKFVTEKTNNFIQSTQAAVENIFEVQDASELQASNYNEIVDTIRDQQRFGGESDYDSDLDSFISATESVELEVEDTPEDIIKFERNLKEAISKHSKSDFYMSGIEYLTHYGVPVRSIRTELLNCDSDVDFSVKVHCIRKAFKNLLRTEENRNWFVSSGKEMLVKLLQKANYDSTQFCIEFDDMIEYCQDTDNWGDIDEELSGRGVCALNFYDIILDFMIMDSFQDLENPPSAISTAIQNRWLSQRIKETALSTAIWTVIKSKKRYLPNQVGFFSRFYDISMHLTPLLAWGFLGPVKELNDLCNSFKNTMIGFLCDIFSTETSNYKSVHTLSEDILRLAKKRKQELTTLLA